MAYRSRESAAPAHRSAGTKSHRYTAPVHIALTMRSIIFV